MARVVVCVAMLGATLTVAGPAAAATSPSREPFAVATRVVTFVDTTRSTPAVGATPASPQRRLVTHLWYPAAGAPLAAAPPNSPPLQRHAPYPLIVFAHGDAGHALDYDPMLRHWAAAGYVVAAPDFPVSSRNGTAGVADVANQPGDLKFVIRSVLRFDRAKRGLGRVIDARRIGVAGHSLGAATVVALVERSCCADRRVRGAISFSGLALLPGEDYPRPSVPLLLVHGTADRNVPYAASIHLYAAVGPPRYLLTLLGRGHQSWPRGTGPVDAAVLRATLDFWTVYLRGDHAAVPALEHDAAVADRTTIQADPASPGRSHRFAKSPGGRAA